MVEDVFQNLVDQFSDPFTCLRELVQNAMDAGTESIDINTRYLEDPGGVVLEVRDFGEGMTRDIISGKLTRLFSSDKEDDLTKIGKFGIGFVSVFSLKPELVTVDTGRDGEYWRIAFDGGTDFQLFELHEPIEGSSIKIYKLLAFDKLDEFVERSHQTLSRWCRHSHVDIFFNGELLNRPMEVRSECRVTVTHPLGQFSAGLTKDSPSSFGFYNTGLTLSEGRTEEQPGVAFKILSNHLEHTLARDAVIFDENYEKVMARLEDIVSKDLFTRLCQQLCSDPEEREKTAELAQPYLRARYSKLTREQKKQAFFLDIYGDHVSLEQLADCAKEETRFFVTNQQTELSLRAKREGIPVLALPLKSASAALLRSLFGVRVVALEQNLAVSREVERSRGLKSVESYVKGLLREGRIHVRSLVPVEYPHSTPNLSQSPCTFALGSDRLVRRFRKGFWGSKYLLPQQLLLDVHHPLVRKALSRAESPSGAKLAAYVLCKVALLNDGLSPSTEERLLKSLVGRS